LEFKIEFPNSVYEAEPETWDKYFKALQEMANRMAMSYHKYHPPGSPLSRTTEDGEDVMAFVVQRMTMYDTRILVPPCDCGTGKNSRKSAHSLTCFRHRQDIPKNTGNTENCIDAANGLVIERIFPSHPKSHFKSQTSGESPGLVYKG